MSAKWNWAHSISNLHTLSWSQTYRTDTFAKNDEVHIDLSHKALVHDVRIVFTQEVPDTLPGLLALNCPKREKIIT